jgi:hypothetical protein
LWYNKNKNFSARSTGNEVKMTIEKLIHKANALTEQIPEGIDFRLSDYQGNISIWLACDNPRSGGWNSAVIDIDNDTNINTLNQAVNQIIE